MAVPVSGMTPARRERNGNKHKRLFLGGPGGLTVCHLLLSQCAQSGEQLPWLFFVTAATLRSNVLGSFVVQTRLLCHLIEHSMC